MSAIDVDSYGDGSEWRVARVVVLRAPGRAVDAVELPARSLLEGADPAPRLDEDGLLRFRGEWVAIPETQVPLARLLVVRFQAMVSDSDLAAVFEHRAESGTQRAVAGALHRLRRRVRECGLSLSRVRGRGYILDDAVRSVR
jgi:hypothetical protein